MCSAATAMMIVRRQNACPDSDYATLVTTATGGTESLDEFYATAQDSDPSIQPADGVSLSGVSGVAHSALALAASAAALVAPTFRSATPSRSATVVEPSSNGSRPTATIVTLVATGGT